MAIKASGLLDTPTVAELLGCTPRHVRKLIREGKLEAYQVGQRTYRVSKESAIKFLEEQKDCHGRFN